MSDEKISIAMPTNLRKTLEVRVKKPFGPRISTAVPLRSKCMSAGRLNSGQKLLKIYIRRLNSVSLAKESCHRDCAG